MFAAILLLLASDPFEAHVRELSARSFRTRETAQQALYRLGWRALPRLDAARERAADIETARRLEVICAGLRAERLRWVVRTVDERYGPDFPMIDALWLNTANGWYDAGSSTSLWRHWLHRRFSGYLRAASAEGVPPEDKRRWATFRIATRAALIDLVNDGVPLWVCDLCVMEMWRRDNIWIGRSAGVLDPFWWPGLIQQKGFPQWTVMEFE